MAATVRVLIADDTGDFRMLLRMALQRDPLFEVVGEAGDGSVAVQMAAEVRPDLVLLDLAMPVMDGLQALPLIKQRAPEAKVVVLSAFEAESIYAETKSLGADAYLEKGIQVPALLAELRAVLEQPERSDGWGSATEEAAAVASDTDGDGKTLALELLSTAAHELRSPVTAIQGLAEVVTEDFEKLDQATKEHVLGGIKRQSARLVRVVEDLLTAARLESGGVEVGVGPTDVLSCVRLAQETLSLESETVEIQGGDGVVALGDADRIVQILVNYLSNAVRYGRPPFRVAIEHSPAGDVAIAVHDRGKGVPDEFLPRLFEKFSRASTRGPGTGLGLYIVKALAQAQGGDVWYEASPDGGACFGLRLRTV